MLETDKVKQKTFTSSYSCEKWFSKVLNGAWLVLSLESIESCENFLCHTAHVWNQGLHSGHVTRDNNKSVYLSISFVFAAVAENTTET